MSVKVLSTMLGVVDTSMPSHATPLDRLVELDAARGAWDQAVASIRTSISQQGGADGIRSTIDAIEQLGEVAPRILGAVDSSAAQGIRDAFEGAFGTSSTPGTVTSWLRSAAIDSAAGITTRPIGDRRASDATTAMVRLQGRVAQAHGEVRDLAAAFDRAERFGDDLASLGSGARVEAQLRSGTLVARAIADADELLALRAGVDERIAARTQAVDRLLGSFDAERLRIDDPRAYDDALRALSIAEWDVTASATELIRARVAAARSVMGAGAGAVDEELVRMGYRAERYLETNLESRLADIEQWATHVRRPDPARPTAPPSVEHLPRRAFSNAPRPVTDIAPADLPSSRISTAVPASHAMRVVLDTVDRALAWTARRATTSDDSVMAATGDDVDDAIVSGARIRHLLDGVLRADVDQIAELGASVRALEAIRRPALERIAADMPAGADRDRVLASIAHATDDEMTLRLLRQDDDVYTGIVLGPRGDSATATAVTPYGRDLDPILVTHGIRTFGARADLDAWTARLDAAADAADELRHVPDGASFITALRRDVRTLLADSTHVSDRVYDSFQEPLDADTVARFLVGRDRLATIAERLDADGVDRIVAALGDEVSAGAATRIRELLVDAGARAHRIGPASDAARAAFRDPAMTAPIPRVDGRLHPLAKTAYDVRPGVVAPIVDAVDGAAWVLGESSRLRRTEASIDEALDQALARIN